MEVSLGMMLNGIEWNLPPTFTLYGIAQSMKSFLYET